MTLETTFAQLSSLFVLGLLGTGHCVGMCGPLVLAVPSASGRFSAHGAYHLGRVLTYSVVGAIMGGIGAVLARLASDRADEALVGIGQIQAGFSIVAALFLFGFGLLRLGLVPEPAWMSLADPAKLPAFGRITDAALRRGRPPAIFAFGTLMGLLPCGLSYAAFARALPAGGAAQGAVLVLAFGLGTVPGLFLVGTAATGFAKKHRQLSDLLSGILMIGMAASLGVRALVTGA